ncbi:hypothetical protein MKW94_021295 [Papaver nudicaule]|uniref:50S ribosomal protein L14, chloroplastic n=1 Tax=Papaver nudicaule TaxID=74823 RepID=A0AA41RU44_PAPNU|nr:hypothetical protein [Papaver nudicaule]
MIQPQTLLNVADNSGARKLMCIRIIGASNRRYAHIGDVIVAVIKEAVPNMPLERSEVIRAVVVRTCKELKRDNGMIIRYDDNAAVVIDQEVTASPTVQRLKSLYSESFMNITANMIKTFMAPI